MSAATIPELVLFTRPTCPWCRRVTAYADEHGISLTLRDTSADPLALKELERVGGKRQVPCLLIDGQPLYESADIIAWLAKNVVAA